MNPPASSAKTARMRSLQGGSAPFAWAAFLLGLVFPGLGHASIGEKGRGIRIAAGFLVLWIGGMLVGGPNSVQIRNPSYSVPGGSARAMADSSAQAQTRGDTGLAAGSQGIRLWFLPQAGAGPIAFLTAFLNQAMIPDDGPDMIEVTMPDRRAGSIDRHTAVGHALDFGTLFCALAGLMNVAIALDAGRSRVERRGGDR